MPEACNPYRNLIRTRPSSLLNSNRMLAMLDIVFLALGLGLFALLGGYAWACSRL